MNGHTPATTSDQTLAERIGAAGEVVRPQHPDVVDWHPARPEDLTHIMALLAACDGVEHPTWTLPPEEALELFQATYVNAERDTLLGFDATGRLVAAGAIMFHPSRDTDLQVTLDGRVHPTVRGRGIGRELMRWEHERALQALAELPETTLPATVLVHAEEADTGARHLAARRGLREERWFTTMVRDLSEPIPEVGSAASDSISIVAFTPDWDEAARVARNDAFRDHWGSLEQTPERWSYYIEGPTLRRDLSRIAVEEDRIVGFALAAAKQEDWAAQGYSSVYIDLVGVVRDRRGRHLAGALITSVLRAARDAGLDKAVLDVDASSPTGADRLYTGLGFAPSERAVALVARY